MEAPFLLFVDCNTVFFIACVNVEVRGQRQAVLVPIVFALVAVVGVDVVVAVVGFDVVVAMVSIDIVVAMVVVDVVVAVAGVDVVVAVAGIDVVLACLSVLSTVFGSRQ